MNDPQILCVIEHENLQDLTIPQTLAWILQIFQCTFRLPLQARL